MAYRVEISSAAFRDLKRLAPGVRTRLYGAVSGLRDEPRPVGVRKLTAREGSYRIRLGDVRVIYRVFDDQGLVMIGRIVRRGETTYRRQR